MTLSTTSARVTHTGNGSTTAFAFPFKTFLSTDLAVYSLNLGILSKFGSGDYTVSGLGDDAGGTVTMVSAPAVGETLIIERQIPLTQTSDFTLGGAFPSTSHEQALDRLVMMCQFLNEELNKYLQIGMYIGWGGSTSDIPANFLDCDGSSFLIADYPDLNNVLGTNVTPNVPGFIIRAI